MTCKDAFSFSRQVRRRRDVVERFFNRIKQFHGRITRYGRRPDTRLAALKSAAIRTRFASRQVRAPGQGPAPEWRVQRAGAPSGSA